VRVIEAAVAAVAGKMRFSTGVSRFQGGLSSTGDIEVDTVSLDALSATLPGPQYMKIDVEGAEALVLRGAEQVIRANRPIIFLATHGYPAYEECRALLTQYDYELLPIAASDDEFIARPIG
jgi:FkbM family methyltransferase